MTINVLKGALRNIQHQFVDENDDDSAERTIIQSKDCFKLQFLSLSKMLFWFLQNAVLIFDAFFVQKVHQV